MRNNQQPQDKPTRYEVTKTFSNRCKHRGIKPTGGNKHQAIKHTGRIKLIITILFLLLLTITCKNSDNPIITINTELGKIKVELYQNRAPVTVKNFLEYINKGLFNDGEFYRVVHKNNQPNNKILIEVIQGGIGWDDNLPRLDSIEHETTYQTSILHKKGTISMARNEPGSASSEFFICLRNEPELDYGGMRNIDGKGFAAFGKVIEGMSIVERINQMPDSSQMLISPIKILSVTIY